MTTTIDAGQRVDLCEIVNVMEFAHQQVYGHLRSEDHPHGLFCACPPPWDCPATRLGETKADALVILITRFAFQVHTPEDLDELLSLNQQAKT